MWTGSTFNADFCSDHSNSISTKLHIVISILIRPVKIHRVLHPFCVLWQESCKRVSTNTDFYGRATDRCNWPANLFGNPALRSVSITPAAGSFHFGLFLITSPTRMLTWNAK